MAGDPIDPRYNGLRYWDNALEDEAGNRRCLASVPTFPYAPPYPKPIAPYHECVSMYPGAGPIEAELRELSTLWQPSRYNQASEAALNIVNHHWSKIGLPTGAWAYENMDDAWTEAIEAAEALGL